MSTREKEIKIEPGLPKSQVKQWNLNHQLQRIINSMTKKIT